MRQIDHRYLTLLTGFLLPFFCLLTMFTREAEAEEYYEPIFGTETTFKEFLVMDENAHAPRAAIRFSVKPGQALAAADKKLEVFPGVGTPRIPDVFFTEEDPTYAETQQGDSLKLATGWKYSRKTVTADFTGIRFTQPGLYRYLITEHVEGIGIEPDEDVTRTLDVYIQKQGDRLAVLTYVMYRGDQVAAPAPTLEVSGATKSKGFVNSYVTGDLSFGNEVKGVGREKDRSFPFILRLSGAGAGTVYDVEMKPADALTAPKPLTAGPDGTVLQRYDLRDGQYITVKGIARGTEYEVTEEETELYNMVSGTKAVAVPAAGKKHSEDYVPARYFSDALSGTIGTEDIFTGITNYRIRDIYEWLILFGGIIITGSVVILILRLRSRKKRKRSYPSL